MLFTPAGEIHLGKIFSKCVAFVENPYLAVVDDIYHFVSCYGSTYKVWKN